MDNQTKRSKKTYMHGTFSLANINGRQILSRGGYVNTDLWNIFKSQTLMGVRCRLDRSWQHVRCPSWPMTQWFGAASSGGHCSWSNLKHIRSSIFVAASSTVSGDSARPSPGRRFLQSRSNSRTCNLRCCASCHCRNIWYHSAGCIRL